jgi:hypothetical protein
MDCWMDQEEEWKSVMYYTLCVGMVLCGGSFDPGFGLARRN